jgi:hypothetical protein
MYDLRIHIRVSVITFLSLLVVIGKQLILLMRSYNFFTKHFQKCVIV